MNEEMKAGVKVSATKSDEFKVLRWKNGKGRHHALYHVIVPAEVVGQLDLVDASETPTAGGSGYQLTTTSDVVTMQDALQYLQEAVDGSTDEFVKLERTKMAQYLQFFEESTVSFCMYDRFTT